MMDIPGPERSTGADAPRPIALPYETLTPQQAGPRPWWAWAIVGVYLLAILALATLPAWGFGGINDAVQLRATILVALWLACGVALMLIPVRAVRRRPITRRTILIPIIASGILAATLFYGGGLALAELIEADVSDTSIWLIIDGAAVVWLGWIILFALIAGPSYPARIGMKLHRWLIAGSVLELLVAVPTHIVVRRRGTCCAGIYTGIGICFGVAVMLLSFGPSVLLLFYRRHKRITGGDKPKSDIQTI